LVAGQTLQSLAGTVVDVIYKAHFVISLSRGLPAGLSPEKHRFERLSGLAVNLVKKPPVEDQEIAVVKACSVIALRQAVTDTSSTTQRPNNQLAWRTESKAGLAYGLEGSDYSESVGVAGIEDFKVNPVTQQKNMRMRSRVPY
jgi:hypothetical protein